jgi:hypothetical protein
VWRAGVAVVVAMAALGGAGATPAGAEPQVRVHPTTDLVDQQKVKITVSGFPFSPDGENRVAIIQCAAEATDSSGCGDFTNIAPFYDATGSLTLRYRVSRMIRTPAFGTIDCAATPQRCLIVVTTLDLARLFTFPISFDPTVPALPPVEIDAALDPAARINVRTGVVTLSGNVSCTSPTPILISGYIGQQQGDIQIFGGFDITVRCTDTSHWSVRVRSQTPGTAFTEGVAFAYVNVAVDRSGPRDRVEIDAASHPLVARHPH